MRDQALFDKIDLHLIRVLHTVLTERSVSKAAIRLGMYQPAVSASLKKLRELAGDPLLVRSGAGMVPTDAGLRMLAPSASILRAAESMFSDARSFEPGSTRQTFRIAASDFLDPLFLPRLVAQIKQQAPHCVIEILPLSAESDYRTRLAQGDMDVVIGNWLKPPEDLHLGRLFGDEVVCLVAHDHPAVRRASQGGWDAASWVRVSRFPVPNIPASSTISVVPSGSRYSSWGCRFRHSWSSLATVADGMPVSSRRTLAALAVGATAKTGRR